MEPEIFDVKFLDGRLGVHRINSRQQVKNKSVYLQIKSFRVDIYQEGEQYKFVNVPYDMLKFFFRGIQNRYGKISAIKTK